MVGVKYFIHIEAFDHFVASGLCFVCLGVSGYGLAVSAPIVYKQSSAFISAVKPALAESFGEAINAL